MINLIKLDSSKYLSKIYSVPAITPILSDYSKYNDYTHTLLVSDNLQDLNDLLKNDSTTGTISPGSKIYFSPDSLISPLFLSKLKNYNVDIKRVLKPEKADIIVTSKFTFTGDYMYLTSDYQNNQRFQVGYYYNDDPVELKTQLDPLFGFPFYYSVQAPSARLAQKYYLKAHYPNKIVHDNDFIKYIYQFLPIIDDDTFSNALSMLNNTDKNVREIGTNCLQYYNLGERVFDLVYHYYNRNHHLCVTESQMSQSEKFISAALNVNMSWHYYYNTYSSLKIVIRTVIDNQINTLSMEQIAQKIVDKYLYEMETDASLESLRDALKLIGYTVKLEKLPDDQNGETESGD